MIIVEQSTTTSNLPALDLPFLVLLHEITDIDRISDLDVKLLANRKRNPLPDERLMVFDLWRYSTKYRLTLWVGSSPFLCDRRE